MTKPKLLIATLLLWAASWTGAPGAPVIQSLTVQPSPLLIGQEFTVSAGVSADATAVTAVVDLRPNAFALLNVKLSKSGGNWSGTSTIPGTLALGADIAAHVTVVAVDAAGARGVFKRDFTLQGRDTNPPTLAITSPADGSTVSQSPVTVSGTVTDDGSGVESVTCNGVQATLNGNSFTCQVALSEGPNLITIVARDRAGNSATETLAVGLMTVADTTPPTLSITLPSEGAVLFLNRPRIEVAYGDDQSGVATASLALTLNGAPLPANCELGLSGAVCTPVNPLPEGLITLGATVRDVAGNSSSKSITVTIDSTSLNISVTEPVDGLITNASQIQVKGTVGPNVVSVSVNGVTAAVANGGFDATVPMREGVNMLVALATSANGKTGTDSVDVTRDNTAPIVRITSPRNGLTAVENVVTVTGQVNDIVDGAAKPLVSINGIPASVSDGSFFVADLPLVRGPNQIEAVATDAVGNVGRHSIQVEYRPPAGARICIVSGNGQSGIVNEALANPLTVQVIDNLGNPVAGRIVTFGVTRNNALLKAGPQAAPSRLVQVPTDGSGRASSLLSLGDTTGAGNNRVVAVALGVAGEVEFCATGVPRPAQKILMVAGDNQRGVISYPLAVPLQALVVDGAGNPVDGIDVIFRIQKGGGSLNGLAGLVKTTGSDGIARAVLKLGPEPGINNNVVSAEFAGLAGLPATFTSSGLAPGRPEDTTYSGVVLDNGHTPIPGALITIPGSAVSGTTDSQGQFLLRNVPVGNIHLRIDPANSPRPETFPPLEFETVTIAGQANVLGQSILLPALQTSGSKMVGGNQDVTLAMPGVAGLELTVFANSVTFPGGARTGQLTISQVHLDKVPMPPPSGTIFMPPAWTLQPAGVQFDPPAKISIPNDGLPAGRVIDIFQFDHALYEFINVGKGTVTEDAAFIISDPGFGITRTGWGGCGQPQPPTTCAGGCDDGNPCTDDACVNGSCVHTPKTTPQTAANGCKGCDNGMEKPPKTEAECCADNTVTGMPVTDASTHGWVVCCNGRKTVCVKPLPPASFPLSTVLDACAKKHEEQHFDDIDCPTGNDECKTNRPNFKNTRPQADGECDAYTVTIACLRAHDCMGDAACQTQIDAYVESYKNIANGFKPGCVP